MVKVPRSSYLRIFLYSLAIAAVAFRIVHVSLSTPEQFDWSDMGFNRATALNILNRENKPIDAWKPLGYPVVLAGSFWLNRVGVTSQPQSAILALQLLLSLGIPALMFFSARAWLGKDRAGIVGLIALLHYQFTEFAGVYMAETLFTFSLAALVFFATRSSDRWDDFQAACVGGLWGCATLIKSQALFFMPMLAVWIWRREKNTRAAVVRILVLATAGLIPLGAMSIFTTKRYPDVPKDLLAAVTFVNAKCPACDTVRDSEGYFFTSPVSAQRGHADRECKFQKPFSDTSHYWNAGWKCVIDHPAIVATAMEGWYLLFLGNLPWPFASIENFRIGNGWTHWLMVAFLLPGFFLAIMRFRFERPWQAQLLSLLVLSLLVMVYVMISEARYRVPFDVAFIPLAVWGYFGSPLNVDRTG